jgi:hypothetical protein
MRITEGQLRQIIRQELLHERREASASDVVHHEPAIRQWVEKLLVDLGSRRAPKIKEMDAERRRRVVDQLTRDVSMALLTTLGSGSTDTPRATAPLSDRLPRYGTGR